MNQRFNDIYAKHRTYLSDLVEITINNGSEIVFFFLKKKASINFVQNCQPKEFLIKLITSLKFLVTRIKDL